MGRIWSRAAILAATIAAGGVPASAADNRVALVVGNASYADAPLRNPVRDARAMAQALRRLDFEVIALQDADKRAMEGAVVEFARRLGGATTALFYYAGHGVQVKGHNYLIPVDASIASEPEIRIESVGVGLVLDEMAYADNPMNIVILDACRNNPFERRVRGIGRGLAAVDAARGTIIAYATAPGAVALDGEGENGLYTEELLRALEVPGLEVEEVFKRVRINVAKRTRNQQIPWESSSLIGEFVFNQSVPRTRTEGQAELLFWQSVEASGSPEAYGAYLDQFPGGAFAALARVRIAELERSRGEAPEPPPATALADPSPYAPAAAPGDPSGAVEPAATATLDSPAGSGTKGERSPYRIAVLPAAGRTSRYCPAAPDSLLVDRILEQMDAGSDFVAVYYRDGNPTNAGFYVRANELWRRAGMRQHPDEDRAFEYGRRLGFDAVLLLWYEVLGSVCDRIAGEAYLFDVEQRRVYRAPFERSELDATSRDLRAQFRRGRAGM